MTANAGRSVERLLGLQFTASVTSFNLHHSVIIIVGQIRFANQFPAVWSEKLKQLAFILNFKTFEIFGNFQKSKTEQAIGNELIVACEWEMQISRTQNQIKKRF